MPDPETILFFLIDHAEAVVIGLVVGLVVVAAAAVAWLVRRRRTP